MICERCGHREATEHFSRLTETSITAAELCRQCYIEVSGPVDLAEARWLLKLEAELGADTDWTQFAHEWIERSTVHKQHLPPEIADFLRRRGPGTSS